MGKARELALAPLRSEGAVEQVVRRLGEAIGTGVLAPGERLPAEQQLAARLGVAPMTLRQALAILRDAGFVETRRGRAGGSFVRRDAPAALPQPSATPPTAARLRELTDFRRAISGEASALAAARASGATVHDLRAADAAVAASAGDAAAFRLADARFHVAVAEASRSERLIAAETQVQAELGEILRFAPGPAAARRISQAGHAAIVAAIAAGDEQAARVEAVRHAEATHDWIVGLRLGLGRAHAAGRPAACE